jgi:hypothetical protein
MGVRGSGGGHGVDDIDFGVCVSAQVRRVVQGCVWQFEFASVRLSSAMLQLLSKSVCTRGFHAASVRRHVAGA